MTYDSNSARKIPTGNRKREPQEIKQVLQSALKQFGIDQQLARYEFILEWERIVGKAIAERTKPISLKNGKLVVQVTDSVWAQELSFQSEAILKRLQSYLGESELVQELIFTVG